MNQTLPPEDSPPIEIGQTDRLLRRQLEAAASKCFYEGCDGVTQALLTSCEWSITTQAPALTLILVCSDTAINRRMLKRLKPLGTALERLANCARIRICPPEKPGQPEVPLEIQVAELDIYEDFPWEQA